MTESEYEDLKIYGAFVFAIIVGHVIVFGI